MTLLLTELLATAYSGRKTQEEALVLLGAESKTAATSAEVRALLHSRESGGREKDLNNFSRTSIRRRVT